VTHKYLAGRRSASPLVRVGVGSLLAAAALAAPAQTQTSIADIAKRINGRADEIAQAERLLRDPDRNKRVAAMEALLKSGDPAFIQVAKAAGLTSSDPIMRAEAVKAVLDAGGTFVAEFTIPADDKDLTKIYDWLKVFKGSWSDDRRQGFFTFSVGAYNEEQKCWTFLGKNRACVLLMSGESVATGDWNFNITGSAVMQPDETGTLTGSFLVNGQGTPVTIRIPLLN
jgi:hypothetical protein